jgi:hypothetical protein
MFQRHRRGFNLQTFRESDRLLECSSHRSAAFLVSYTFFFHHSFQNETLFFIQL